MADEFAEQRPRLFGLAYRLLGAATEAEDAVQDAYLRWRGADRSTIDNPGAWLTTVVTNLCLTRLTSARARRETYVGPWLPEPVLTDGAVLGPMDTAERREQVSMGLLLLMEKLTPVERAVFVLREAFGYPHREIAGIVSLSEENCRQVHSRARRRIARPGVRPVDRAGWRALVDRFLRAAADGDLPALERLLAEEATSVADSDGRLNTARRPVSGRAKVARYLSGVSGTWLARLGVTTTFAEVNGAPAVLALAGDALVGAMVLDVAGDRVTALHIVANPDKLAYLGGQLSRSVALPSR
ncbi:RNA polymerase sigma-70 factor [Actinophytocola gossypii]|uniref:RNA polymerase sigma-70 factor n=1 Tax=Actinophytocola gossypii TaxID=2812003 RepID=A0ABT2JIG0_9PSEU|nr:RNA polymerase sigma-70 factor [Actinophytocola gossypii]MCT2587670.1 RNA polymerase sigma-70 factor [Actinophytocola gossypii]